MTFPEISGRSVDDVKRRFRDTVCAHPGDVNYWFRCLCEEKATGVVLCTGKSKHFLIQKDRSVY